MMLDLYAHFLGAAQEQQSPEDAGYEAAVLEAEKRDYGTSDEDLEAYGSAAGAAAGAAGCVAAGAAVVAPICGVVGGKIGGAIVRLFTGSAEEEAKRHREQAAAWLVWEKEIVRVGGSYWATGSLDDGLYHRATSDLISKYQQSIADTGVTVTKDEMFLGQDGPNGSIAWRMLQFGWGERFKKYPGWYPPPQVASGWGAPATQAQKDAVNMQPAYEGLRNAYAKWILQGFNSDKFNPAYSASVNANYAVGYAWQKVVGQRIEAALNEFSHAFTAAATPLTAQAAAVRARHEQTASPRTPPVVVVAGAAAAAWLFWEFVL